ncbi:MAG: hypothetical protein QM796_04780 [Chthoniobacteraceae bacterium]
MELRIAPATLTVTNLDASGAGSLLDTIAHSHGGDRIVFSGKLAGTIELDSTIDIGHRLSIIGNGQITLDGGGNTELIEIDAGAVVIKRLTLANGYDTVAGGAISSAGNLTLSHCTFTDNTAGEGGAISAGGAHLSIHDCVFENNSATAEISAGEGGAVDIAASTHAQISDSQFVANTANNRGGAIYVSAGSSSLVLKGDHFLENQVTSNYSSAGGAIYDEGGKSLLIKGSVFSGNQSTMTAGALQVGELRSLQIKSSTFTGNQEAYDGAVDIDTSSKTRELLLTQTKINGNSGAGGLVMTVDSNVTAIVAHCQVEGNTAASAAGMDLATFGTRSKIEVISSIIAGNLSTTGEAGGAETSDQTTKGGIFFNHCDISDNSAGSNGGGVYLNAGRLKLSNDTLHDNYAPESGGGVYLRTGVLDLADSVITDNLADSGGGIYNDGGKVKNLDSIIRQNRDGNISP